MSASTHHLEPDLPAEVDLLSLAGAGTAYVRAVLPDGDATTVLLDYPRGRAVSVTVPLAPAAQLDDDALSKPLAVHVRVGETVECAVLNSTSHGARRVAVGLDVALRLAADGVHTVVRS